MVLIFIIPIKSIIDYENFYQDNRWRLQGLQVDFSYKFDRFIRTLSLTYLLLDQEDQVNLIVH